MTLARFRSSNVLVACLFAGCALRAPEALSQERPAIAGREAWITDFAKHTVPLDEIASGGPSKDGIPSIDRPSFVSVREADDWLEDREPVAVVRLNGAIRAYPLSILIWHEIVNDWIAGDPVTVTYCPLCNTTLAFDRRFAGQILDFGATGRLRHSDLVMYDRQSETWWQQATGEGIVGEHAGARLTPLPAVVMSWRSVKTQMEHAQVLSRETGFPDNFTQRYGRNPYQGYDRRKAPWRQFFRHDGVDARLPAMERVVALERNGQYLAVPFSVLRNKRVAHVRVDDLDVVVFWASGTASAVDHSNIAEGRDVGSSQSFSRVVNGRTLTFEPDGNGRFRDRETGSTWHLSGRAVEGELEGTQLTEVVHGNHFWFAWGVFRPETKVWSGE